MASKLGHFIRDAWNKSDKSSRSVHFCCYMKLYRDDIFDIEMLHLIEATKVVYREI